MYVEFYRRQKLSIKFNPLTIMTEDFPIPRKYIVTNKEKPIIPDYSPQSNNFNPELFQVLYSLNHHYLDPYELIPGQESSSALVTFCAAFDDDNENSIPRDTRYNELPDTLAHRVLIIRLFLLSCQNTYFDTVNNNENISLTKLAMLHNELFFVSEVIRSKKIGKETANFCDMLMADILDSYNSEISKIIENDYWGKNKTCDELINGLLSKEVQILKPMNRLTFQQMSSCGIRRAIEKAPPGNSAKLKNWAKENKVVLD